MSFSPPRHRRAAITALGGIARPYLSRAADRPRVTHGVQSGDVSTDSGVVWSRTDRPARMLVEISTTESFSNVRSGVFVEALPETDFTAKALIEGLPAAQDIFYRIRFQDLNDPTLIGEPVVGRFHTAPADRRSISFVRSGDTAGPLHDLQLPGSRARDHEDHLLAPVAAVGKDALEEGEQSSHLAQQHRDPGYQRRSTLKQLARVTPLARRTAQPGPDRADAGNLTVIAGPDVARFEHRNIQTWG